MIKNIPALVEKITQEISDFTDIAVIGMSGGADSTLVATLCAKALGRENVYGFGLPYSPTDESVFNNRSKKIANKLGMNYQEISILGPVNRIQYETEHVVKNKLSILNLGNMRARMRMIFLYTLNQEISEQTGKRCRVIGTGNLSEDYIGYDTKGGDALADIFPIGQLFKSEVYQLLEYFVENGLLIEDMIDRNPSAGLWDGQTDEGELGYTYNEMEPAIRVLMGDEIYFSQGQSELLNFVGNRHKTNKHKHESPQVIDLGDFRV